jgi:hypothetical protein
MELQLITPPSQLISTSEAKTYLRVDNSAEDAVIDMMVNSAVRFVEESTGIKLLTQTWKVWFDSFGGQSINDEWWDGTKELPLSALNSMQKLVIPFAPLASITSLKTYDQGNVESTFSSSNYFVKTAGLRPAIILNDNNVWPVNLRSQNAIEVTFVVGKASASLVDPDLVRASYLMLAHYYENRGDETQEIPDSVKKIFSNRKNWRLC